VLKALKEVLPIIALMHDTAMPEAIPLAISCYLLNVREEFVTALLAARRKDLVAGAVNAAGIAAAVHVPCLDRTVRKQNVMTRVVIALTAAVAPHHSPVIFSHNPILL
jgi:hypothetical protein